MASYMTTNEGLGLSSLEIGTSLKGVAEYYEAIQSSMIDETIKILDKFDTDVLMIVQQGWAGKSYDKFAKEMKTEVEAVKKELKAEGKILKSRLETISKAYHSIDENIYG